MPITPEVAFTHLSKLAETYLEKSKTQPIVDVRSLTAPPEEAFSPKRNRLVRFLDSIRFHFKTSVKTKEYQLSIPDPAYNEKTNRRALRVLFKAAIEKKVTNPPEINSLENIIQFAFARDTATESQSCFNILKGKLLEQIGSVTTIQDLCTLCRSPMAYPVLQKEAIEGQNDMATAIVTKLSELSKKDIQPEQLPAFGTIIERVFEARWMGIATKAALSQETVPTGSALITAFNEAKSKDEEWFKTFSFPARTEVRNVIYVNKEAASFAISTGISCDAELEKMYGPLTELLRRKADLPPETINPILQDVADSLVKLSEHDRISPKQKSLLRQYAERIYNELPQKRAQAPSQPATTVEKTNAVFTRTICRFIPSFWQVSNAAVSGAIFGAVTGAATLPLPFVPFYAAVCAVSAAGGALLDPVAQEVGKIAEGVAKKGGASEETAKTVGEIATMGGRVLIYVGLRSYVTGLFPRVVSWWKGAPAATQTQKYTGPTQAQAGMETASKEAAQRYLAEHPPQKPSPPYTGPTQEPTGMETDSERMGMKFVQEHPRKPPPSYTGPTQAVAGMETASKQMAEQTGVCPAMITAQKTISIWEHVRSGLLRFGDRYIFNPSIQQ